MRRSRFSAVSFLLVVLSLLTTMLWVRSYWRGDALGWHCEKVENYVDKMRDVGGHSSLGTLEFFVDWRTFNLLSEDYRRTVTPTKFSQMRWKTNPNPPPAILEREGFWLCGFGCEAYWHSPVGGSDFRGDKSGFGVAVPHWFLSAVFLVCLGVRIKRSKQRLSRWRRMHRVCVSCGYDLRATPDCCPECGTEVTAR